MFDIRLSESALADIRWFRQRERRTIMDGIERQLVYEPGIETRNRKRLRPNRVAEWELRIDDYRVVYDVKADEAVVEIKLVGLKNGNQLLVRGKEYEL